MNLAPLALATLLLATPAVRAQEATALAGEAAAARSPDAPVEVQLKSGPKFRGVISGEDERNVLLRSSAGTVRTIPRASIARIVPVEQLATTAATPAAGAQGGPAAVATGAGIAAEGAAQGTMIGLGVNLRELDLLGGGVTLYVPIQVRESARVEVELGFATALGSDEDIAFARAGLGVFGTRRVASQVRTYGGARLSFSHTDVGGAAITVYRVAAALGAEWVPVSRVALGVEGQAAVAFDVEQGSDAAFGTSSLAFLRVFF